MTGIIRLLRISILPITLLISIQTGLAQSKEEVKYVDKLPNFTMFGDNYLTMGTTLDKSAFSPSTSDAKFQIGFKERLTSLPLPFGVFPFLSYKQKSFWDIYRDSFPFRETNYNPSVGFSKIFVNKNGQVTDILNLALEHESNGRDKAESRSWNFISLNYIKPIGHHWQIRTKFWVPVGERIGNEDITSYRGYCSLGATYKPFRNAYLDIDLQPAYKSQLTGFVKVGMSFKISDESNQFLYIQYFGGYAEDLINYNQSTSRLRIGIIFKDLLANFRK